MDGTDLVDAVREDNRTELSRLGSSKSLYADTEGEMEPDAVLRVAADTAYHAAETFENWAGEDVDAFAAATARERGHYEPIAAELDAHQPGERPAAVESIHTLEAPVDRLGGLVGWTLVAEEKASQCSGFFTGQADPKTASLFRGFGDDYQASRQEALDALATLCDDDWAGAETAAASAVGAAYDEYFETLESLGVNPKPVC